MGKVKRSSEPEPEKTLREPPPPFAETIGVRPPEPQLTNQLIGLPVGFLLLKPYRPHDGRRHEDTEGDIAWGLEEKAQRDEGKLSDTDLQPSTQRDEEKRSGTDFQPSTFDPEARAIQPLSDFVNAPRALSTSELLSRAR